MTVVVHSFDVFGLLILTFDYGLSVLNFPRSYITVYLWFYFIQTYVKHNWLKKDQTHIHTNKSNKDTNTKCVELNRKFDRGQQWSWTQHFINSSNSSWVFFINFTRNAQNRIFESQEWIWIKTVEELYDKIKQLNYGKSI